MNIQTNTYKCSYSTHSLTHLYSSLTHSHNLTYSCIHTHSLTHIHKLIHTDFHTLTFTYFHTGWPGFDTPGLNTLIPKTVGNPGTASCPLPCLILESSLSVLGIRCPLSSASYWWVPPSLPSPVPLPWLMSLFPGCWPLPLAIRTLNSPHGPCPEHIPVLTKPLLTLHPQKTLPPIVQKRGKTELKDSMNFIEEKHLLNPLKKENNNTEDWPL